MAETETIDLLIEGGKAKPGPTTAPKLGVYKVNMGKLFQDINEQTKDYKGMNVPVKVIINKKDGSYSIKIGTPPVSSLIKKELGLKKITEEKKEEEEAKEPEESKKKKDDNTEKKKTKKELKKEKAEKAKKTKGKKERVIVGNLTMGQCIKIMKMKRDSLLAKNMKKAVKEVVSSVVSMPLTIEGKSPKEVLKEIDEGKYDDLLKEG